MYGNTLTRSMGALTHMVTRPRDGVRWWKDRLGGKKSPIAKALPWISWPCIDFLTSAIRPGMRVFEWGGGGSTFFFLRAGCNVTTVESNEYWKQQIDQALAESPDLARRSELRLIPASSQKPANISAYIESVRTGGPWDIILVDGLQESYLSRMECLNAAISHVKPGGYLVLDDAYRTDYADAPNVLSDFTRREFWGLGPSRMGVTKTDVYSTPSEKIAT
jgi:hypothetical protein